MRAASLVEGQARHFETPSALVNRYAGLIIHGLPPDHEAGFADRLAGIDVASLQVQARERIDPESLVAIVVADADGVIDESERPRLGRRGDDRWPRSAVNRRRRNLATAAQSVQAGLKIYAAARRCWQLWFATLIIVVVPFSAQSRSSLMSRGISHAEELAG